MECKHLDIWRKRIFKGKQPAEEVAEGLGYKILELFKFTGVDRPYSEFGEHNKFWLVGVHGTFELHPNLIYAKNVRTYQSSVSESRKGWNRCRRLLCR